MYNSIIAHHNLTFYHSEKKYQAISCIEVRNLRVLLMNSRRESRLMRYLELSGVRRVVERGETLRLETGQLDSVGDGGGVAEGF